MKGIILVLAFVCCSVGLGGISASVSPELSTYETIDFLEAYGCAYSTFRVFRPQSYVDLKSSVDAEGAELCEAPEWLLRERTALLHPFLPFEARVSPLLMQSDLVSLAGTESSVNGLYPLRQGRKTYSGFNLNLELDGNIATSSERDWGIVASVTPGFFGASEDYDGARGMFYLHEWYLKAGYRWVEILLGRLALGFGGALHGSLMLSQNNSPFDLVKLTVRPHILGQPFGLLGPLSLETWVADLGDSRNISDSRMWGVGLGLRPLTWFEIAFLELNQFGGRGVPQPTSNDFLKMLVFSNDPELNQKRDRAFATHLSIWGPSKFVNAYVQIYFRNLTEASRWLSEDMSTLVGILLPKLGKADLRVEYINTVPMAYRSSLYLQGLTNRGSLLGHPLGPDAHGAYLDFGLPDIQGWKPTLGIFYEARAKHPMTGFSTEYRYGGGLGLKVQFKRTFVEASARYATVQNQLYQAGVDNQLFAVLGTLRYSLL